MIKYLIEHSAVINHKNNNDETPLTIACFYKNENIVKYLIEHDTDMYHKDNCGNTPIINACKNGNENIVKYLMEHGAGESQYQYPYLPYLIISNQEENNENDEMIKYIKEQEKIANKNELLLDASYNGNEKIVEIFN